MSDVMATWVFQVWYGEPDPWVVVVDCTRDQANELTALISDRGGRHGRWTAGPSSIVAAKEELTSLFDRRDRVGVWADDPATAPTGPSLP